MKNLIGVFLLISLSGTLIIACQKNTSATSSNKSTLTLSKQSVKKGEPLLVTANVTGNPYIKWSVSPSANTWISSPASTTTTNILFYSPGNYLVTANYFVDSVSTTPIDSSFVYITVSDSLYNGTTTNCNVVVVDSIIAGDQLTMTPVNFSDTGLVLSLHSQDLYANYYPSFGNVEAANVSNTFGYNFTNVLVYPCYSTTQPSVAAGTLTLTGVGVGSYSVVINFNGVSYQGVLTSTSTSCRFTWNYTSGVIISPLEIQKQ